MRLLENDLSGMLFQLLTLITSSSGIQGKSFSGECNPETERAGGGEGGGVKWCVDVHCNMYTCIDTYCNSYM